MKQRLTGLVCAAAIVAIVVGLPVALLAVGNPLPSSAPAPEDVWSSLTSPDDGRLALAAITVLGWVCWLVMTLSVGLEVAAQARGRVHAPRVRGLGAPQSMARGLVTGAMLLVTSIPAVGAASAAPTHVTAAAAPAVTSSADAQQAPAEQAQPESPHEEATPTSEVTVKAGDSLWALALEHLGDGREYTQILELNREVLGGNERMLTPGTTLRIPTPAAANTETSPVSSTGSSTRVTVEPGDTLSAIASDELGSTEQYPRIVDANRDQVSDPDHIEPGWVLNIPDAAGSTPSRTTVPAEAPDNGGGEQGQERMGETANSAAQAAKDAPAAASSTPAGGASEEATATPSPTAPSSGASPSERPATQTAPSPQSQESSSSAWIAGVAGAGAILGAGLYGARRVWRRRAMRARRPGRTIIAPSAELEGLERTITRVGAETAVTVEWMDQALRRLAAASTDAELPKVVAVELSSDAVTLYLEEPMPARSPWLGSEDQKRWVLPGESDLDDVGPHVPGQEAPWPLLVTIGRRGDRPWWLLNVEDLSLVINGDPQRAAALARYVAAEIAVNAWSQHARVHVMGVGAELKELAPERIVTYDGWDEQATAQILLEAIECVDRADDFDAEVATLRARRRGEDLWPARALVVDGGQGSEALSQLEQTLRAAGGRSGTGLIQINPADGNDDALVLHVDEHARVRIPHAGLEIDGVGLSEDEARACAQLASEYRRHDDAPIPVIEDPSQPWQEWSDAAGAIRAEHTLPRETPADDEHATVSLLEGEDEEYLEVGATTVEDLATLSPQVDAATADEIIDADPTLDEDLAEWWSSSCARPRVTFLGPVEVRTVGGVHLTERVGYSTEVVAYLALREHGATNAEVQEAFGIAEGTVRRSINTVRDWLGTHPGTGAKHLPSAGTGPKASARGSKAYELVDVLVDADLFRRLRLRAQARGAAGVDDLLQALRLVQGVPFSQLRPGGWSWLSEGERIDEVLTLTIVDTAHLATTACLRAGDLHNARLATMTALRAAPYEDIPRLDMARVTEAEGERAEAETIVLDEVCNASDVDGEGPVDLSDRTRQVVEDRQWGNRRRRAS